MSTVFIVFMAYDDTEGEGTEAKPERGVPAEGHERGDEPGEEEEGCACHSR
jgi:hypothetical protein